jgi:two-component system CheB/CheR fusion protein
VSQAQQPPKTATFSSVSTRDLAGDLRAVHAEANRALLERYGPPGVLVNDSMEIVHFRGHTGAYLEPSPGDASLNLLKLAREGLLHGLRSALQTARRTHKPARKGGLRVRSNGGWTEVDLEVIPLTGLGPPHFLVLFERTQGAGARRGGAPVHEARRSEKSSRVQRLEEELASTREYLQSIIQEVEAANEELQSANEEILSSNEELQSTNEELDTAKEELQSTNQELNTLNEELHARNDELTQVNSDLVNLLGSVQIAIVIVSSDLRIRRFTPMAEKMLNLIPADVGRPITQVKPNIVGPDLGEAISEVIDKVQPLDREVQDRDGRWYSLRIRPYKGLDNRIEGAVLALFDIDSAKRQERQVQRTRAMVAAIVETVAQPLAVLDGSLRIQLMNRAFRDAFQVADADAEARLIYELRDDGSLAKLRAVLEDVVREKREVEGIEVTAAGGWTMVVNARPIDTPEFGDGSLLVAFQEPTGQTA